MPELPDIVLYIESLRPRVVGRPLERVRLRSPFLLRSVEPPLSSVEGRTVRDLRPIEHPGYWKGKNEAFVAFASVPFGLDAEGYNIWLYEKGGLEMIHFLLENRLQLATADREATEVEEQAVDEDLSKWMQQKLLDVWKAKN